MARTAGTEPILEAAAVWRDRCLVADGSVFSDGRVWTREHLAELVEFFIERPEAGEGSFLQKLQGQLARPLPAPSSWLLKCCG